MKLTWGAEEEAFRDELLAFLDAEVPEEIKGGRDWIGDESPEIPQWASEF